MNENPESKKLITCSFYSSFMPGIIGFTITKLETSSFGWSRNCSAIIYFKIYFTRGFSEEMATKMAAVQEYYV